jgi:hypothetical protein
MKPTKITVKVHSSLLAAFNKQLQELPIKRDAFLNHIICIETKRLAEEMEGKELSAGARRHISRKLRNLGTTPVNLVVDAEIAKKLNNIVEESNMVRDAFINRLIMFLRSSDKLLDHLDLSKTDNGRIFGSPPASPMKALEETLCDPLAFLHEDAKRRHGTSLYLLDLPTELDGFSCYLEDDRVPGTEPHKRKARELDELTRSFESFEKITLPSLKSGGK